MPRLHSASDASGPATSFQDLLRATLSDKMMALNELNAKSLDWYKSQSLTKRILLAVAGVVCFCIGIIVLIFHKYVIGILVSLSDHWEKLSYGRTLLFTLIFFVGFPPLLGFSALSMLSGMVYGFPLGWPLLATASIAGSLASFLVFRYLLRSRAERLVQLNEKFRAFAEILKDDASLVLLILLRLCPLPYSLSNGALAAIPELPALTYFLASLITSPKMLLHVFVGHSIKNLGNVERPTSAKIADVVGIIITACAASLATYVIYNKMQTKLESYHHGDRDDELVFGNFEDDLESGTNVELEAGDFDEDNFIIGEADEPLHTKDDDSIKKVDSNTQFKSLDDFDGIDASDLDKPTRYRDY